MKNQKTFVKSLLVVCSIGILFSCEQQSISPSLKLDEVFIPEGYVQVDNLSIDAQSRLEELRLENQGNHYYYLKVENGPVNSIKDLMFPQKELLIEYAEKVCKPEGTRKFNGVIVKKITGDWTKEEFKYLDQQPQVKGGMKSLYEAISENIKYPEEAKTAGIEGKVFVEFVVKNNGELANLKTIRGIGYGCDEEAIRVLKLAATWIPAKVMDMNVSVKMIIPIVYKLSNKQEIIEPFEPKSFN